MAIQLAKHSGLRVIASASKPESIELSKACGADHVIDYSKVDVVSEVLKLTNGEGVDVAIDSTYVSASFIQSAKVVKKGGRWIRVGPQQWNSEASDEEAREVCKQRGVEAASGDMGRYYDPKYAAEHPNGIADILAACDILYKQGVGAKVTKVVPFDLEAVRSAESEMEHQRVFGKVVVKLQ